MRNAYRAHTLSRAMSAVAIDARDAFIEPLRGWGRYARELIGHLPPDLETRVFERGDIGPRSAGSSR